jgi:hypothetical protein
MRRFARFAATYLRISGRDIIVSVHRTPCSDGGYAV